MPASRTAAPPSGAVNSIVLPLPAASTCSACPSPRLAGRTIHPIHAKTTRTAALTLMSVRPATRSGRRGRGRGPTSGGVRRTATNNRSKA